MDDVTGDLSPQSLLASANSLSDAQAALTAWLADPAAGRVVAITGSLPTDLTHQLAQPSAPSDAILVQITAHQHRSVLVIGEIARSIQAHHSTSPQVLKLVRHLQQLRRTLAAGKSVILSSAEKMLLSQPEPLLTKALLADLNSLSAPPVLLIVFEDELPGAGGLAEWLAGLITGTYGTLPSWVRVMLPGPPPLSNGWGEIEADVWCLQMAEPTSTTPTTTPPQPLTAGTGINRYIEQALAALSSQPPNRMGALQVAEELQLQGDPDNWGQRLTRLAGRMRPSGPDPDERDQVLDVLGDILALPGLGGVARAQALALRAAQYTLVEDFMAALTDLTEAMTADGQSSEFAYRRGQANLMLKRYEAAAADFSTAIAKAPDAASESQARLGRGRVYFQLDQLNEALTDLNRAAEKSSELGQLHYWRGRVYIGLENYPAALEEFTQAIDRDAQNDEVYHWRGRVYRLLKDHLAALNDLSYALQLNPQSSRHYYWRGLTHFALDNYETAIRDFDQVLALQPDEGDNYYWRGRIYYEAESFESALADFNEAIGLQPDDFYNYYWRGLTYYALAEYEQAISELTQALTLNPENYQSYYWRGRIYHETLGNSVGARIDFETFVRLRPDDATGFFWRGLSELESDDLKAAISSFRRAIALENSDPDHHLWLAKALVMDGQTEAALEPCLQALKLDPDDNLVLATRVEVAAALNDWATVVEITTQALADLPNDSGLAIQFLYYRGLGWLMQEHPQAALEDAEQAVALALQWNTEIDRALTVRARVWLALNQTERAINDLDNALAVSPENASLYYWRGRVYAQGVENYTAALADLTESIRLAPHTADAYIWRARLLTQRGETTAALLDFNYAIDRQPEDSDAYYWRGLLLAQKGEHKRAIDDFSRVIAKNPDDDDNYLQRALAYAALDQLEDAIGDLTAAIRLRPEEGEFYFQRGQHYFNLDQHQTALNDFDQALRRQSNQPEAYFWRSKCLLALGHRVDALAALDRALALDPAPELLRQRGLVRLEMGNATGALDDFSRALADLPELAPLYAERGVAEIALGKYEAALTDLEKALEIAPDTPTFLQWRGVVFFLTNRYDEALNDLDAALAALPSSTVLRLSRGRVLEAQGRFPEALVDFEAYLAALPDDGLVQARRVRLLLALNDTDRLWQALPALEATVRNETSGEAAYSLARAYVLQKRGRQALVWLGVALDQNPELAESAALDAAFEGLRTEARFVALLRGSRK